MNTNNTIAMNHTITFQIRNNSSKPTDYPFIQKNLKTDREVSIKEFSELVTQPYGYTFTPCKLKGLRSSKNWESSSIIGLDFDNGMNPDEAIAKVKSFGLRPNVVYSTFSDTPEKRKFRIILFLDKLNDDKSLAAFFIKTLIKEFPNSDKSCSDVARLFHGGIEVIYLDETPNEFENVMQVCDTIAVASNARLDTKGMWGVKTGGTTSKSYIYNIGDGGESPKFEQVKNYDFTFAATQVQIFKEFMNGVWLEHPEIFGLACNLNHIEGGLKLMTETMNKYNKQGKTKYTQNNFASIKVARKNNYAPKRLENFSPYESDYRYLNMLSVYKPNNFIEETKPLELIKLITAELKAKEALDNFLNTCRTSYDNVYSLCKLGTGLGKTQMLTSLKNVVLAFPTHDLIDEVSKRMLHTDWMVTPKTPIFSYTIFNTILNNFWDVNSYSEASSLIRRIALNKKSIKIAQTEHIINDADRTLAKAYLDQNEAIKSFTGTVLTTHTRALFGNFYNHSTIIFDEDPMSKILTIGKINTDFASIKDNGILSQFISDIEGYMTSFSSNFIQETLRYAASDSEDMVNIRTKLAELNRPDLINMIDSDIVLKNKKVIKYSEANLVETGWYYGKKEELPNNKNILIMSGTASEFIWKLLLPEITVTDICNIETVGSISQHTTRSYSRSQWSKYKDSIKDSLMDEINGTPVITYKSFKHNFVNPVAEMHFGNCEGYDTLKGQDISVVGTYNRPPYVYQIYAELLGFKLKTSDTRMEKLMVEYRDMKFEYMTFNNDIVRGIQFGLIESELIQAANRGRVLREDCTVKVFSNFPIYNANEFVYERITKGVRKQITLPRLTKIID